MCRQRVELLRLTACVTRVDLPVSEKSLGSTGSSETRKKKTGHPRRKTRVAGVAISEPNGRRCET